MKDIRIHEHGGAEQLAYDDAPIPFLGAVRHSCGWLPGSPRGVSFIVKPSQKQLIKTQELIDSRIIWPAIFEEFPLAEARQAFRARSSRGHILGELVSSVQSR
jgi:hypothetical protein